MFRNSCNTQSLTATLTRFLLGVAVLASFAAVASAQIRDVYLGIKTGNESGAGSYGSKIKVKITFVNNTGATEVGESWLNNATLEAGGWSMAKLSMRYDMNLNPSVKMIRLENHGTNSSFTGDNWLCESVCVSYDGNLCSENFVINQWINGGAWVERDNPNFRTPRRPEPPRPVVEATPTITVDMVLGTFQRTPVENGYHTGSITRDGDQLRWTNQAGVSWGLIPDVGNNRLLTNRENPYYQDGHREFTLIIANGRVRGIRFAGEDYLRNSRIPTVQPPQPAPEPVRPNPEPVAATTPEPDMKARDANGDTLLHQAIRARDARAITDYVRRGVDVNASNNAGLTPLSEAVRREDQPVPLVKYLLRNSANPNAPDAQGNTPVAYAAHTRNAQLLLALLEAGGDVNVAADHLVREGDEQTFRTVVEKYNVSVTNEMFTTAVRNRNYGIAELGIGRGVDANYALDTALQSNVRQLVEPALRAGANADAALKFAMQKRDSALAQLALSQYNANADLALQLAIPNNDLSILQLALQKGANANRGMEAAAKLGNQPMVEALLSGRADPNVGLMPAVQAGKGRIVELLVTRGANPNPAMPFAVKSNDTNLVTVLLRANANGNDPQLMALAAGNQNLTIVKMLLAAGADANAGMEAAVTANSLEVTRFLLDNKADGTNPRFIALGARNGNRAMVTMFLERGADPTAGLGGAVVGGHADLVDFLLKSKANGTDPRLIAHAAGKGDARVTALLLTAGAQAEAGMKAGVNSGSAEVVNLLADAGANAKVPEYILSACKAGNAGLAVALLKHDAPKDVMDERGQPLIQIAALTWKLDLVTALLQNGVDPNLKNQAGETALHIVARDEASSGYPKFQKMKKGRLPILNALIAGKADVNAANNKGEFVLKVADGGDVKDILKAAGAVKDQKELDKRGQ
ncbi:MAG: ankyrin repeat domain-containing protein [Blastocatellia bacterium]|nr:ankyrin repeat domain-containing protein [Blastocatellia bacterium]